MLEIDQNDEIDMIDKKSESESLIINEKEQHPLDIILTTNYY